MGVFHARSEEELIELSLDYEEEEVIENENQDETQDDGHDHDHDHENCSNGAMARALRDVSYEPRFELWETIKEQLMTLNEN
eukprot:4512580-Ditylum_brightwellii.AAC.1